MADKTEPALAKYEHVVVCYEDKQDPQPPDGRTFVRVQWILDPGEAKIREMSLRVNRTRYSRVESKLDTNWLN